MRSTEKRHRLWLPALALTAVAIAGCSSSGGRPVVGTETSAASASPDSSSANGLETPTLGPTNLNPDANALGLPGIATITDPTSVYNSQQELILRNVTSPDDATLSSDTVTITERTPSGKTIKVTGLWGQLNNADSKSSTLTLPLLVEEGTADQTVNGTNVYNALLGSDASVEKMPGELEKIVSVAVGPGEPSDLLPAVNDLITGTDPSGWILNVNPDDVVTYEGPVGLSSDDRSEISSLGYRSVGGNRWQQMPQSAGSPSLSLTDDHLVASIPGLSCQRGTAGEDVEQLIFATETIIGPSAQLPTGTSQTAPAVEEITEGSANTGDQFLCWKTPTTGAA